MSIVLGKLHINVEKKLSLDLYFISYFNMYSKLTKDIYKTPRNQRGSLSFLSLGVKKSQNPRDKVASGPAGPWAVVP